MWKRFVWLSAVLLLAAAPAQGVNLPQAGQTTRDAKAGAVDIRSIKKASVQESRNTSDALLQFSSKGHILGFKEDRMYMVGMGYALIEEFVGGNHVKPVSVGKAQPTDPIRQTGAPALQQVEYHHLWDGITVRYEAKPSGLAESTYLIGPHAEAGRIRIKYNTEAGVQKDGSLQFKHPTEKGYFSMTAPVAWQDIEGKRIPVEVAFADYGDSTIGFRLGAYNGQYPVVIDPTYEWNTFYGSAGGDFANIDEGHGIAVDTSGNVYMTGTSVSTWDGPGGIAPLHAHSGGPNGVVMKLNTNGAYQWHTFYGGAGDYDDRRGLAVDTIGNVYVTGESYAWDGPGGIAPLHAHSGGRDGVVMKLNTNGAYQWHTFYGSAAGGSFGRAIAVDTSGNVYATGDSGYTWDGPGGIAPLHAWSGHFTDIVVVKLNTNGAYQWHTFYGSASDYHGGNAIAVDTKGNVYVTGTSRDAWDGPGGIAPLHAHGGHHDIVVVKLNTNGAYQWHTFYGSAVWWEGGYGIAVDTKGNVYVTGYSNDTWDGPGGIAPLHARSGSYDIVVVKLNTKGAYQWHTFYGSASSDEGHGIAVDTSGNIYVTGYSRATWDGPGGIAPLHAYAGSSGSDIVVVKLNTNGAYQWHTFYGSSDFANIDEGHGIAVDTSGNIYVTGYSDATWDGPGGIAPLHAHSGGHDIVVVKLATLAAPDSFTLTVTPAGTGTGTVTSSPVGINCGATCGASFTSGTPVTLTATPATGSSFTGWGGDCTADGTVTLNADKTCAATFATTPTIPQVLLTVSGAGPGPTLINPVMVRYSLQGCGGREMFLVLDAPAMGMPWSYLGVSGWVPLPANLATITPWVSSGPTDGTYTLFEGTAPDGTYELYLGCDFVSDGVLNIDAGGNVNGVYDHRVITVP